MRMQVVFILKDFCACERMIRTALLTDTFIFYLSLELRRVITIHDATEPSLRTNGLSKCDRGATEHSEGSPCGRRNKHRGCCFFFFLTSFIPVPGRRWSHNALRVMLALSGAVHIVILLPTLPTVPADLYMHSLALIPQKDHAPCISFFHAEYFPVPPASFTVSMGSTFQKVKCLSPLHCDAYFSLLLQR